MVGVERFAVSVRALSGLAQVTVLNDGFFFRSICVEAREGVR